MTDAVKVVPGYDREENRQANLEIPLYELE